MNNEEVTKEILKCVGISAPGPHAILLVVRVGRFTEEERETVRLLQKAFGDNMMKYLIVVFTGKDDLDIGKKTVHDMVRGAPSCLQEFLADCDNRYFALNNNADISEKDHQVEELVEMVQCVVCKNGGSYYQSPIFNEADKVIRERIMEKEREQEKDMSRIRRQMEEEFREREREARLREEKLRDQLRQLDDQQEQESARLRHLGKMLDEVHESTDDDSLDDEHNERIRKLKARIKDVKGKLSEVERDRRMVSTSARGIDDKMEHIRRGYNPREEVRNEIESGDANILKRFWNNIRKAGVELFGRFKSLFELLKQKAGFF